MSDSYDVTVSRTNESGDKAEVISIGQAYMVTLDEFGTLRLKQSERSAAFLGTPGAALVSQELSREAQLMPKGPRREAPR